MWLGSQKGNAPESVNSTLVPQRKGFPSSSSAATNSAPAAFRCHWRLAGNLDINLDAVPKNMKDRHFSTGDQRIPGRMAVVVAEKPRPLHRYAKEENLKATLVADYRHGRISPCIGAVK